MTSPSDIAVLIVVDDDHLAARVRSATEEAPGVRVVGHERHDEGTIDAVMRLRPDVLVLRMALPDARSLELCREVWQRYPHLGVVALVPHALDAVEIDNFLAEPHDYPAGPMPGDFRRALRELGDHEGHFRVASIEQLLAREPRVDAHLPPGPSPDILSERELVLLRMVGSGLSNEEIGQRLEIASATARNRVSRLRARLGIATRRRLVAYAAARGFVWIEPEDGADTVGS